MQGRKVYKGIIIGEEQTSYIHGVNNSYSMTLDVDEFNNAGLLYLIRIISIVPLLICLSCQESKLFQRSDSGKRLAKVKPIAGRSRNRREEYGMKLPDAIILATAQIDRYELVTRKAKVLPAYRE